MIDRQTVLQRLGGAPAGGLKFPELVTQLKVGGADKHRLRKLVEELLLEGKIEKAPGARYQLPGAPAAPTGRPARTTVVPRTPLARPTAPPPLAGASARPPAAPSPAPVAAPVEPATGSTHARAEGDPATTPAPRGPLVTGPIHVHPAGYGFVKRDDGEADVFVPARFRGSAIDGDTVSLTTWTGYKGTEGRVVEVVKRGRAKLTGVVRTGAQGTFLEPDDPRIASVWGKVELEVPVTARVGQAVVADITRYPEGPAERVGELWARVSHVLGEPGDLKTEIAKVIACADIPEEFPEDVSAAGKRTSQTLSGEDFADRVDLRDRPFLTIDPETARDFDDAVCVEERGTGYRVWVAVADVSHYVRPGTALDREARIRGCSVYLPDRAIPMLPHELSSGICSLNPEVDRCAMVVRLDVDAGGAIGETAFCAAVIRSHARLDYPGVAAALAGDTRGPRARYLPWLADLQRMYELSQKLRKARRLRGALDFDIEQPKVLLDEDDSSRVRDVVRSKADPEVKGAYQLIEEYMLAANEAVARFFRARQADAMWRVHDTPSIERLEVLAELLNSFGVKFDPEEGKSPKVLQALMADVAGKPYEKAMHFLMLRSLKQAVYDVVPIGHFGLASTDYLHFTSPIRRYPDLIVHRLLKWHLRRDGQPSGGAKHPAPPPREELATWAAECSAHERRAAEAEREVVDLYRAYLVRDRVGDELDGTVSAVTGFGLFVEIDAPYVDGLIRLEQLGDEPFIFDDKRMTLTGRRTGRLFRLGDRVRVRLENVSVARRRIDLALVSGGAQGEVPIGGSGGGRERSLGKGGRGGGRQGGGRPSAPTRSDAPLLGVNHDREVRRGRRDDAERDKARREQKKGGKPSSERGERRSGGERGAKGGKSGGGGKRGGGSGKRRGR